MIKTQLTLFDPPGLDILARLKVAMNLAVRSSGLSREAVVGAMNVISGQCGVCLVKGRGELSLATLERWLNPADRQRCIPVKAIPIFNHVVGSEAALTALAAATGAKVISRRDAVLLEWARGQQRQRRLRKKIARLEYDLDDLEGGNDFEKNE